MIFHDGRGIAISANPVSLQSAADHLNWLAKGSINTETSALYLQARNSYSLLNNCKHTINGTA